MNELLLTAAGGQFPQIIRYFMLIAAVSGTWARVEGFNPRF